MNYLQLQRSLTTKLSKAIQGKERLYKFEYENQTGILDGFQAWIIPNEELVLNIEALKPFNVDKFFYESNLEDLTLTTELIEIENSKTIARVLKSNAFQVCIDQKFLKPLKINEDVTFKSCGKYNPVHIFEKGKLIGFVMPMRAEGR